MANSIVTEQFVHINQTPASIGGRMGAQFIDWGIYLVYTLVMTLLIDFSAFSGDVSFLAIICFFVFLPVIFYTPICEIFNHGQTIGKKLLNIRVVNVDGSTPSIGAYLLRWVLFLIDAFLGIGVLAMFFNEHGQRIGDLAAGTMVIKQKDYRKIQVNIDEYNYLMKNYKPIYPKASDLSLEQVDVISRTLKYGYNERYEHITQLASKVKQALDVTANIDDEKFLRTLIRDYQYYALEDF